MGNNSFKDLEELYIKDRGNTSDQTKKNIGSNINLFNLISNMIDLYIPKAGDVIKSFGSFPNDSKPKNENQ